MFTSYILTFREGLEAALIISILLGVLNKIDKRNHRSIVWNGASIAAVFSIALGVLLNYLGTSFEGRAEEIFEGIIMLIVAGILTWTVFWMQAQSKVMSEKLKEDLQKAALLDNKTALFSIAFLSVFREGIELALFLTAVSMSSDKFQVILGAGLGFVSVVILAVILFRSLVRLDISRFFHVTSIILVLFAAGLVALGVHELNESGIIPALVEHVWDINFILDEKSIIGEILKVLVGYNGNPSLTEVIAYIAYLAVFYLYWKSSTQKVLK